MLSADTVSYADRYATRRHERGFQEEISFVDRMRLFGINLHRYARFSTLDYRFGRVDLESKWRDAFSSDGQWKYDSAWISDDKRRSVVATLHAGRSCLLVWHNNENVAFSAPTLDDIRRWTSETVQDQERVWQKDTVVHVPKSDLLYGWEDLVSVLLDLYFSRGMNANSVLL